jgi:hypothetical protein
MIDATTAMQSLYEHSRGRYDPTRWTTAKNFIADYDSGKRQFVANELLNRHASLSTFLPSSFTDSKRPTAE